MKKTETWRILDNKYNIGKTLDQFPDCYFCISSRTINQCVPSTDARLAVSWESKRDMPDLFRKHDLGILPIGRTCLTPQVEETSEYRYVIAKMECLHTLECDDDIEVTSLPYKKGYEDLLTREIENEQQAISAAEQTGMLQDFLGEEHFFRDVAGKMHFGTFHFKIHSLKNPLKVLDFTVKSPQGEIDASFVTPESFTIVEAKQETKKRMFRTRQLYYPFRWAKNSPIGTKRKIRLVFLVYNQKEKIFTFREYIFKDPEDYNSIRMVKIKKYKIA